MPLVYVLLSLFYHYSGVLQKHRICLLMFSDESDFLEGETRIEKVNGISYATYFQMCNFYYFFPMNMLL